MMKYTGVDIELFTEGEMDKYDFVEKAKCGGITMACQRFFKANNPKCKQFNMNKPKTWLSYVDANNLYGWAMSQYLPIGNYRWEYDDDYLNYSDNNKKVLSTILKKKKDDTRGCFVQIKCHFPRETHDYLNDFPPAVENIKVGRNQLSPKQEEYLDKMGKTHYTSVPKLITHLGPRDGYVLHYAELQYYVKLGMVVDEVQKVLSFDQIPWLEPYISLNSKLRKQAKNDFEKDFFKLMNNSVYGKTMENVRKHIDVKLLPLRNGKEKDERTLTNYIRKPSFKYARSLGNELIGIHMGKSEVILNKPIIVGAAVLGLSKLRMYEFWYDYIKVTYGNKVSLCYMDTDSFIYAAETEDIYQDMINNADHFDFSNYPSDHPLLESLPEDQWMVNNKGERMLKNAGVIGKFKDECPTYSMSEFYGIRAKLYHYVLENGNVSSRHKGVSKMGMQNTANNMIVPEDKQCDPMTLLYRDCLFEGKEVYAKNVDF